MDEIQSASERDLAIGNVDRESILLRAVKAALLRRRNGSFGICIECESEISAKRLAAVPWAPRCIQCQEAADRDGQQRDVSLGQTLAQVALVQRISRARPKPPNWSEYFVLFGCTNVERCSMRLYAVTAEVSNMSKSQRPKTSGRAYELPRLAVGDVLLVGKFNNRKVTITGFSSDENNQPVAQTDKGEHKIFKPRIAKLMPAKQRV